MPLANRNKAGRHISKSRLAGHTDGLYEQYVNNAWYETSKFYEQKVNAPLLEKKIKADIAIIGGGFTGLSSAYHLAKKNSGKRIIMIEGARCGYGASGRNGGHVLVCPLARIERVYEKQGVEAARAMAAASRRGYDNIVHMVENEGLDCDLRDSKHLMCAEKEKDLKDLEWSHEVLEKLGVYSRMIDGKKVCEKIGSDHFKGGLESETEKGVDPAKLVLGIKKIVEGLGVEIFERTRAVKINPGKTINIETEFGEVDADSIVIATNAYSPMLGLFKSGIMAISDYVIATEPLSDKQMESIGWKERHGFADTRNLFNYVRISEDNRIVFGGESPVYYFGNKPGVKNNKKVLSTLEKRILTVWPQLKGVEITHRWGGTDGFTKDELPVIGVMGEHKNIYYGVGYSGEGVVWTQTAGEIISQLYAGEDTELTRFFLVNRKIPYIPPEPLKKIGFEALVNLYLFQDNFFGKEK